MIAINDLALSSTEMTAVAGGALVARENELNVTFAHSKTVTEDLFFNLQKRDAAVAITPDFVYYGLPYASYDYKGIESLIG